MAPGDLDRDGDRLVGLAGDDAALTGLAARGLALGGRRAGAGLVLGAALDAVGRTLPGRLLTRLGAGGGALLGALLRACLGGPARALQATTDLPVDAFVIRRSGPGFAGLLTRTSGARLACGSFILLWRLFLGSWFLGGSLLCRGLLRRSLLGLRLL